MMSIKTSFVICLALIVSVARAFAYTPAQTNDVSVWNYMSPAQIADVSSFTGSLDVTTAVNNAAAYATTNNWCLFFPAGRYSGSNFVIGSNLSSGTQSSAPPCIHGAGPNGTILKIKSGTTGTGVAARSTSGVRFQDLTVDCNNVTGITTCLDLSWPNKVGADQEDVIDNVWVQNYSGLGIDLTNVNQTSIRHLVVRQPTTTDCSQSAINLNATGGSAYLTDVTATNAILDIAVQNAYIIGGFNCGVRINRYGTADNILSFVGTQIYLSPNAGGAGGSGYGVWDYSPASTGHWSRQMTFNGVFFTSLSSYSYSAASAFNFRVVGSLNLISTLFGGPNSYSLFGAGFASAAGTGVPQINYYGISPNGDGSGTVTVNTPTGFDMNDWGTENSGVATSLCSRSKTYAAGMNNGSIGNGTITGSYTQCGNTVNFSITLTLGSTTVINGTALQLILPVANGSSIQLAPAVANNGTVYMGTMTITSNTQVANIYYSGSSTPWNATAPFTWTTGNTLTVTGTYHTS